MIIIKFKSEYLVIADDKQPIALAGIMGGKNSMIDQNTNIICLNLPIFLLHIKRKWRKLANSDALHRFERGVDLNIAQQALKNVLKL